MDIISFSSCSVQDKVIQARLKSLRSKYAGRYQLVSPEDDTLTLSDADFIFQAKLDLGISPVLNLPSKCVCGTPMANDSYNSQHWRDCIKTCSRAVRLCHDRLKTLLALFAREALIPTHMEPFNLQAKHQKRPDLELMFSDGPVLVDVATTNPIAASHRHGAAKTHLDAAKKKELLKSKHYAKLTQDEAATFYPFVLETFGAIAPKSLALLTRIHKQATDNGVSVSLSSMVNRLAIALAKGNALIIRQGAINTRNFICIRC
jgi:hypothetical protein